MRIFRILNNNAVVVVDGPQEKIVMGNGVGLTDIPMFAIAKDRLNYGIGFRRYVCSDFIIRVERRIKIIGVEERD
jgi:hypothetical protein